ncbi:MAG: hypothetical protein NT169_11760 [Chloroflexi bacterium]|nr:hypothetical protein [Chloroflexota bacterium]
MAEIRKKDSSGFQSAEVKFDTRDPMAELTSGVGQGRSASGSGFDSGVGQGQSASAPDVEPTKSSPSLAPSAPEPAQSPVRSAQEEPKKRYYNPQEVMKKKGCIGCGGMVLAAPIIVSVIALAVHLL